MKLTRQLLNVKNDPQDSLNVQYLDTVKNLLTKFNLRTASDVSSLPKETNNAIFLTAENHSFPPEKPLTRIDGMPGCNNSKNPVTFVETTSVFGVDFTGSVSLSASSSVIFNNCRFAGTVAMTSGARAHFIGCVFYSGGNVNNAGAVANAYIIGCVRKSGVANTNVTVISETV